MSGVDDLFEFLIDTAVSFYRKARNFFVKIFSSEPVFRDNQHNHSNSLPRRNTPNLPQSSSFYSLETPRPSTRTQPARRKKFEIIETSQPVVRRVNFTNSRRTEKFKNIIETMPHQCPYCKTKSEDKPGNIIRADDGWKCKSCDYTW